MTFRCHVIDVLGMNHEKRHRYWHICHHFFVILMVDYSPLKGKFDISNSKMSTFLCKMSTFLCKMTISNGFMTQNCHFFKMTTANCFMTQKC